MTAQSAELDAFEARVSNNIDPVDRISLLGELAFYYLDVLNDNNKFDSLSDLAISSSEVLFDREVILEANLRYLKDFYRGTPHSRVQSIIDRTLEIVGKSGYAIDIDFLILLSDAYLKISDLSKSHQYASKAISQSSAEGDELGLIRSQIALGRNLEFGRQYIEAYQNYMNAQYGIEKMYASEQKNELKTQILDDLFRFYQLIKDYDGAAFVKSNLIDNILKSTEVDSTAYYWHQYDLAGLSLSSNRFSRLSHRLDRLLDYADRAGNIRLRDYTLALYRSLIIESEHFGGFENIYVQRYPELLSELKSKNKALYYKIVAYIHESRSNLDSAEYYFKKAEPLIVSGEHNISRSNFYRRLGEFFLRHQNVDDAVDRFRQAFNFAQKSTYTPYIISASGYLDTLLYDMGKYEEAYAFQKMHFQSIKQRDKDARQDELLRIHLDNEAKQLKLMKEREDSKKKKKYNLQYLMISIGILSLFILIIFMSRIAVPEWIIHGSGFLGVLMVFEFIILILDQQIHHLTHGAPLYIFLIKILILVFLFPLHHVIEGKIIRRLMSKKQIWKGSKNSLLGFFYQLWPWLNK